MRSVRGALEFLGAEVRSQASKASRLQFARTPRQRHTAATGTARTSERWAKLRATPPEVDMARFLRGRPPARVPAAGEAQAQSSMAPDASRAERMRSALKDRFGRQHTYLRVSLTERCSLRCTYCMPLDGVALSPRPRLLTSDEILAVVEAVAEGGVTRVRLTGGEPLLRPDWEAVASAISSTPGIEDLAVTTNALALSRRGVARLVRAGVTSANVSLDTLVPSRFEALARRPAAGMHRAISAIRLLAAIASRGAALRHAQSTGSPLPDPLPGDEGAFVDKLAREGRFRSVKINAVALRGHTEREAAPLAALARLYGVEVRFIEAMPFAGNDWAPEGAEPPSSPSERQSPMMPMAELLAQLSEAFPEMEPHASGLAPPGQPAGSFDSHATARVWSLGSATSDAAAHAIEQAMAAAKPLAPICDGPAAGGRVGVIASMTAPFCGGCNRLRLTADGNLRACLFGSDEVALRDAIRTAAVSHHDEEQADDTAAAAASASRRAVLEAVREALAGKHAALGGHQDGESIAQASEAAGSDSRPMILIGG